MKDFTLEEKQAAALEQGRAYTKALDMMKKMDVHAQTETDEYIVTLACEKAEGMYEVQPQGDLQWEIPKAGKNLHLEIAVQDKEDLRFIPELLITATVMHDDQEILSTKLPFLWHPFLYHYGADAEIPKEGEYTVQVHIAEPTFGRHDEDKGKRYTKSVTVEFSPIQLTPGRKEYGPE